MKATFTILMTLFLSVMTYAEVSVSEKNALIELNKATQGQNWTKKWDFNAPVSTWYGVKLFNDRVVAIDLSDNNLSGMLPTNISDLKYLRTLNLFKNQISGTIPQSIGNLKSLQVLNLSFNKLSGSIPLEIADATSLKEIVLLAGII